MKVCYQARCDGYVVDSSLSHNSHFYAEPGDDSEQREDQSEPDEDLDDRRQVAVGNDLTSHVCGLSGGTQKILVDKEKKTGISHYNYNHSYYHSPTSATGN